MKPKPFLVWVLCGLQLFFAAGLSLAAGPASPPTPAQLMVLQDAAQKGVLTPEAREIVAREPGAAAVSSRRRCGRSWRTGRRRRKGLPPSLSPRRNPRRRKRRGRKKVALSPFDWRKSVYVSRLFQSRLTDNEARQLTFFGHELFDPRAEVPQMGDALPAPDDYVVGPGDELVVKLWGRVEGTHRLRVDRDGKVFIPKMGPLSVAGKTLGEVKTLLRNKFGTIAEVQSDVSIGQMKGFLVSVLGRSPVAGPVPGFLLPHRPPGDRHGGGDQGHRLAAARAGQAGQGNGQGDRRLRLPPAGGRHPRHPPAAGDAVFVPVVGPLVAVAGEVRRQAIYELKGEKTIREVLETAGGLAPSAYKRRVQVERLEENRNRVVIDLNLEEASAALSSFRLQDGDILRILALLTETENMVEVSGNVRRPGKYEWKPGLTVGSLIPDEKFFLPETFLDYALITRLVGPDRHKEILPVNLRKIVVERDAASDVALQPMDTLTVYNKSAYREKMTATVNGEVRKPGAYEVFPGTLVSDLVKLGGDLTRDASLEEAELSRLAEDRQNTILIKINLRQALAGDASQNLLIQDRDHLMVRPMPDLQETRYISLKGEVRSPGMYAARKGERLSSILQRAGGYTKDAFLRGAIFTRVSVQKRQQELIDRMVDQLEQEVARTSAKEASVALDKEDVESQKQVLEARKLLVDRLKSVRAQGRIILRLSGPGKLEGSENDLVIEPGDSLEIPRTPEVVNVLGSVYNPTGVVYNPADLDGGVLPPQGGRPHGRRRPRPHLRGPGGRQRADQGHRQPGVLDHGRQRPDVREARGRGRHRGPGEADLLPADEGRQGHHPDHDADRGHGGSVLRCSDFMGT